MNWVKFGKYVINLDEVAVLDFDVLSISLTLKSGANLPLYFSNPDYVNQCAAIVEKHLGMKCD